MVAQALFMFHWHFNAGQHVLHKPAETVGGRRSQARLAAQHPAALLAMQQTLLLLEQCPNRNVLPGVCNVIEPEQQLVSCTRAASMFMISDGSVFKSRPGNPGCCHLLTHMHDDGHAVKVNPRHPRPAAGRSGVDGNSEGAKDFTTGKEGDKNREFLPFHSDQGATDLIALLSVTAAPKGGESKWVSSIAIHNELLRQGRKVVHAPFSSGLGSVQSGILNLKMQFSQDSSTRTQA